MGRLRNAHRGEDGVFLILWAVLAVGLFGMVAIVIDLGALRADRREQRAAADAAVTAAAHVMVADGGANACAVAWQYATTNLEVPSGSPPCGAFPPCGGAPWSVTGTSGPYRITITHPVLTGDALLAGDSVGPDIPVNYNTEADGAACDRVGVHISSSRMPIFARVLGYSSNRTSAHSVARIAPGGPGDEPASLVLLERHDCRAARTQGSATRIIIDSAAPTATSAGGAGIIQADSRGDGSCPGGARVLEGQSTTGGPSILARHLRDGSGTIVKQARIGIFAKLFGATNAHTATPGTIGEPTPVGFKQVGRSPVDSRYLDNVRALDTEAALMVEMATVPPGFTDASGATGLNLGCNINLATPLATPSKLWFNCPGPAGLTIDNLSITAPNAEIVVNGPLTVRSTGLSVSDARKVWVRGTTSGPGRGINVAAGAPFRVNQGTSATCTARVAADRTKVATLFVREGTFLTANTTLQLCSTFVYLRGSASLAGGNFLPASVTPSPALPPEPASNASTGRIDVGAGSLVDWTGPNELTARPTTADLAVYKYEDLSLWTESSAANPLNGGGGMTLGGVFFLPNANAFEISGNAGQSITVDAQFFVRKLDVTGNSVLRMVPNPENQVPIPTSIVALIR